MKIKTLIFIHLSIILLISCSRNDNTSIVSTNPIASIPDAITPENVRSFMVDPNATDETVALFYNLRKLSQTKFAIGQQDAFNGFYGANGDSDIKKLLAMILPF